MDRRRRWRIFWFRKKTEDSSEFWNIFRDLLWRYSKNRRYLPEYKGKYAIWNLNLKAKYSVIVFQSKKKMQEIQLNGVPEVKKVKLLFLDHVSHLTKIVSYKILSLKKVSKWLTDTNLEQIVKSLILSNITYCSEIYLRLPKVRKKVQKLLNAAARLATRKNRYANCETMMLDLGWLNMHNLYRSKLLCSFRRIFEAGALAHMCQWMDLNSRSGSLGSMQTATESLATFTLQCQHGINF